MKRNLIFKLLILICIFTLINSCRLFLRSRIVLNLNKESKGNKEYIISILEEYTDNTEKISKVAYGREWRSISYGHYFLHNKIKICQKMKLFQELSCITYKR